MLRFVFLRINTLIQLRPDQGETVFALHDNLLSAARIRSPGSVSTIKPRMSNIRISFRRLLRHRTPPLNMVR